MRGVGALTKAFLIELSRSKAALFWTLLFPLVFLIGFAYLFGGGESGRVTYLVPGLLTITIISATFFGLSMSMVSQREQGIFRRFRVTPITSFTVVMAFALMSLANIAVSLLIQLVVAWIMFDVTIQGSILALALAILLSTFAFIPLGLIVGSAAKDIKTAPVITNLLFFPLMFLSGAALPFFMLPDWIKTVAGLLPATYVVEVLQGVIFRGDGLLSMPIPILILVVSGVTAFVVNTLVFRWESTEPLNKKNVALAISCLAGVYLIAFLVTPAFKMAEQPSRPSQTTTDTTDAPVTVLRGLTVFDGLGNRLENVHVVLAGTRIQQVATDADTLPEEATVVDLTGRYAVPGLIDSHVHIGGSAGGNVSMDEFMPARTIRDLQTYLAFGVTAFVSLTDSPADLVALRDAIDAGTMRAPRPFLAGASVTAPGGHPAARFQFAPGLAEMVTRQVTTPDEAREAINELADLGVDLIKLVLEEGSDTSPLPRLSEPAFRAAVATAKQRGLKTTVHVDSDASAQLAIDAGADGLEHIPADLSDASIALMAEWGITLTPTLAVMDGFRVVSAPNPSIDTLAQQWVSPGVLTSLNARQAWFVQARQNPNFRQAMQDQFAAAQAATQRAIAGGVTVLAGSDAGNAATFHGLGLIRELELLVESGMTPLAALQTATGNAADRLGYAGGRIAPDAPADLLILNNDPTTDIHALRDVQAVYWQGQRLDRTSLLTDSPGTWTPGSL